MTTTAVLTVCSAGRLDHLDHQARAVRGQSADLYAVAWVGDEPPPADLDADVVLHVPPGRCGIRIAAARNAAADRAVALGADVLVLLDADCVPGPGTLQRYAAAATRRPHAVLCGPVTYLPPGVDVDQPATLAQRVDPHPARPRPDEGELLDASPGEYDLFWSLSFAVDRKSVV